MKKIITLLFTAVFLVCASSVSAQQFNTQSMRSGDSVIISRDETIDRNLFVTGRTVTVSGTVNGDLYAAGGTVIVDGTINGDILAAGGFISISGEVSEDVRVAGGQITINGTVEGDVTMAGGNLDITESADIAGSLVVTGGNLFVASPVGGNINAGLGNLTVLNSVDGDIEAFVGSMNLSQSASVSGNIDYWSENQLILSQDASVSGRITKNDPRTAFGHADAAGEAAQEAFVTTGRIMLFLSLLLLGLLIVKFTPNYTQATVEAMTKRPFYTALIGLIGIIVAPILAVVLMITIIGLPLGLILLFTYFVYLYVSRVFFIYWIGQYSLNRANRKTTVIWTFVIGIIIYGLIALIPIIGDLFKFIALLLGFGAMLITHSETYKKMRKQKLA